MRMARVALTYLLIGLAIVLSSCDPLRVQRNGSVAENEEKVSDRVVRERLKQVDDRNLKDMAAWFKPHYKQLVKVLDKRTAYAISEIMMEHGRPYAVENLEPFLYSEKGEKLRLVSTVVFGLSVGLHPDARAIVLRVAPKDEIVGEVLDTASCFPESEAIEAAGVGEEAWFDLTESQKWVRLQEAWGIKRTIIPEEKGKTGLHWLVRAGETAKLRAALATGIKADARDRLGCTALHIAARWGRMTEAKVLLDNGADPNAKDKYGWIPLHEAAADGAIEVGRLLIARGSDVNAADHYWRRPMHLAMVQGSEGFIRLLFARGADPNAEDYRCRRVIHWAVARGDKELLEELLRKGADASALNEFGCTPLHMAVAVGRPEIIKLLLPKVDPNARDLRGNTALNYAVACGNEQVVGWLLDRGADPNNRNDDGRTPLHDAAIGHSLDLYRIRFEMRIAEPRSPVDAESAVAVVQLLLEHGADVNPKDKWGITPIGLAAHQNNKKVVAFLLKHGADPNSVVGKKVQFAKPLLHWACENGYKDLASALVSRGAEVEARDWVGATALHYAASGGSEYLTAFLIEHGADVNALDTNGAAPLSWAAGQGRTSVTRMLIENGAEVLTADKEGRTPLHRAAEGAHKDVVALLLENKAEVNAADAEGRTPLHLVAKLTPKERPEMEDVIRLLIARGANVNATDKDGNTPLQLAISPTVRKLLRDNGAVDTTKKESNAIRRMERYIGP